MSVPSRRAGTSRATNVTHSSSPQGSQNTVTSRDTRSPSCPTSHIAIAGTSRPADSGNDSLTLSNAPPEVLAATPALNFDQQVNQYNSFIRKADYNLKKFMDKCQRLSLKNSELTKKNAELERGRLALELLQTLKDSVGIIDRDHKAVGSRIQILKESIEAIANNQLYNSDSQR